MEAEAERSLVIDPGAEPERILALLGQLLYLLEAQPAIAGELFSIDAFDQPEVEVGKIATYTLLGRPGYEQQRQQIQQAQGERNPRATI